MKTITRSITFPDELYKKLEQSAKNKSISVASLIKLACSEYLEREEFNKANYKGYFKAVQ